MLIKRDVQTIKNILTNTKSNSMNQAGINIAELILGKSAINYDDTIDLIALSLEGKDKAEAENKVIEYLAENEENSVRSAFEELLTFYDKLFGVSDCFKISLKDYLDTIDNAMNEKYTELLGNLTDKGNKDNVQLDK